MKEKLSSIVIPMDNDGKLIACSNRRRTFLAGSAWITIIFWAIASILWVYLFYKASHLEITVDEAYSYFLVKTYSWKLMCQTANTHWLNSFFMRLFMWLPGQDNTWKLRMLSLLTWPLFSYAIIKLTGLFKNPWVGIAFFIMCIGNPYLLSFFSLGRGYAAACTFMLLAFLHVSRIGTNELAPAKWLPAFIYASLAVLANFSFFYGFSVLAAIYIFHLLMHKKLNLLFQGAGIKWLVLTTITSLTAVGMLLYIKHSGDLEYGGQSGVVDSLFGSLLVEISRTSLNGALKPLTYGIFILSVLAFVTALLIYIRTKKLKIYLLSISFCIGVVALNYVFHHLFGTPYLLGRTALVICNPLFLGIMGWTDEVHFNRKPISSYSLVSVLSFFLLCIFLINMCKGYNLKRSSQWPTDLRSGLEYMREANAKDVGFTITHEEMFNNYYRLAFPTKYTFKHQIVEERQLHQPLDSIRRLNLDYLLLTLPTEEQKRFLDSMDIKKNYDATRTVVVRLH